MTLKTLVLSAGLATLASTAMAQVTITPLLREGDTVQPGNAIATVLGQPNVNDVGGFAVDLSVNGIDGFWGHATGGAGTVFRTEATIGVYTQTAFEANWGISNTLSLGYGPTCTGGPLPTADTVWVDDTPIAVQGTPVQSLPGQNWVFASQPNITTATGEPWWVSGFGPAATTTNRGIFRGVNATKVLMGGDPVGGVSELMSTAATSMFDFELSPTGAHWIATITLQGATTTTDTVAVLDGSALVVGGSLAREGTLVAASAGGDGVEAWQNFDRYGITEAGTVMMVGDTNRAATATDAFVFVGNQFVMREGDVVGGFPTTGGFSGADLNESGDWAVLWNVNDGAVRECLIVNGQLVLRETDPVDFDGDGTAEATITDISASDLGLGERVGGFLDVYVMLDTSTVANTGEALYRVRIPVGGGCPGNLCGSQDFNGDGDFGTDQDIEAFFACLGGNCCATCFCQGSDFNGDGDFGTDGDIEAFFRVLGGGNC